MDSYGLVHSTQFRICCEGVYIVAFYLECSCVSFYSRVFIDCILFSVCVVF